MTTDSPRLLTNPRLPRRFSSDLHPFLESGEQEHASQCSWKVPWQLSAAVFTDLYTRNQRVQLWGERNRLISIRQIGLPKDFTHYCRLWFSLWLRLKDALCPPRFQGRSEGSECSQSSAVRFHVNIESKNVFPELGVLCWEVIARSYLLLSLSSGFGINCNSLWQSSSDKSQSTIRTVLILATDGSRETSRRKVTGTALPKNFKVRYCKVCRHLNIFLRPKHGVLFQTPSIGNLL